MGLGDFKSRSRMMVYDIKIRLAKACLFEESIEVSLSWHRHLNSIRRRQKRHYRPTLLPKDTSH